MLSCCRLRQITENSSGQIGNGFGSCNNSSVAAECAGSGVVNNGGVPTSTGVGSTGGVYFANYGVDNSSQNSVSGINGLSGPMRHHYLHVSKHVRMGRRVSDGGPYVAAYKLFIEKRGPQLTQIHSNSNIDRSDSTSISSANSIKMLLQEKKSYGGLPSNSRGEWMQYKQQVSGGGGRVGVREGGRVGVSGGEREGGMEGAKEGEEGRVREGREGMEGGRMRGR